MSWESVLHETICIFILVIILLLIKLVYQGDLYE